MRAGHGASAAPPVAGKKIRRVSGKPLGPGIVRSEILPIGSPGPEKLNSCCSPVRRSLTVRARTLGGFRAASLSRNRLARGSSGMEELEGQCLSHGVGPVRDLHAVVREERHGEPVHAESNTTGVGDGARAVVNAPDLAEVLEMTVEAHAGGGFRLRMKRNE